MTAPLEGPHPDRPGVAAFDFDGTLVPGDSLAPFLIRLRGRRAFSRIAADAGPGMVIAYRRGGRDAAKAALLERAVAGVDAARLAAAGESYGAVLAGRIRPEMAARVRWHRDQHHRLILVSASLTAYLEPFARRAGFEEVIATRLEVDGDERLTGRMLGNNVRAEEKAVRLRRALDGAAVELWAYGDSAGDHQMLAMADHPYRVGGSRLSRHRPLFRATPLTGWHRGGRRDRSD